MYTHKHIQALIQPFRERSKQRNGYHIGVPPARTSSQGRGNTHTQAFIQVQEETSREGGTHTQRSFRQQEETSREKGTLSHTHTAFIQAARGNS